MVMRAESTIIKKSCPQYNLLEKFCFEAKSLYNYANYILRQNYKEKDLGMHNFYKLRNYLRHLDDEQNPWCRQATTHIGAGVIQCLINAASKRNFRINDILHKMSRYIISLADEYNCSHIVIGYNPGWKDECSLGTGTNQNFVGLPYLRFVQQLMYKAENIGKHLVVTEESYTSKTSFPDGEFPEKQENYKGRRSYRGLFKSQNGVKINADVNGSYQILKKVFPNAYSNGIEGVSLYPVRVNIV